MHPLTVLHFRVSSPNATSPAPTWATACVERLSRVATNLCWRCEHSGGKKDCGEERGESHVCDLKNEFELKFEELLCWRDCVVILFSDELQT
jgi:hypothetical protein